MYGLHNPKVILWKWHKKVKKVFSCCVWRCQKNLWDAGRNSLIQVVVGKNKNTRKENKM